ncbi:MAG: carbohydrate ABC transporter permease [Thermoplasmataceae archaeon]
MSNKPKNLLWYIALGIVCIFVLFPIYLILIVAISPPSDIFRPNPALIPSSITLSRFYIVLDQYNFARHLYISLEAAFMVSGICMGLGIPAAYTISRMPKKASYLVIIFLFITQMIPEIQIGVPIARTIIGLGLENTALGVAIAQSSIALPMITYILVGAFRSVPSRLSESARIDGATKLGAFLKVDLPLSLTGIYVGVILAWLFSWDEFVLASIISPLNETVPVLIYANITRGIGGIPAADAFSIILMVPVIALVLILQKYLRSNIMAGALK